MDSQEKGGIYYEKKYYEEESEDRTVVKSAPRYEIIFILGYRVIYLYL